jgi:hypothetical protein
VDKKFILTANKENGCLRAEYNVMSNYVVRYKLYDRCVDFVIQEERMTIGEAREQWKRHIKDGWERI